MQYNWVLFRWHYTFYPPLPSRCLEGNDLERMGYLESLHNRELRSYPQLSISTSPAGVVERYHYQPTWVDSDVFFCHNGSCLFASSLYRIQTKSDSVCRHDGLQVCDVARRWMCATYRELWAVGTQSDSCGGRDISLLCGRGDATYLTCVRHCNGPPKQTFATSAGRKFLMLTRTMLWLPRCILRPSAS